jgi:hypothetical protein
VFCVIILVKKQVSIGHKAAELMFPHFYDAVCLAVSGTCTLKSAGITMFVSATEKGRAARKNPH